MNPFNLVREGSDTVVAQACGKCGRVYQTGDSFAARCCDARCEDCGEPAAKGWTTCEKHRAVRAAVREAERIAKATRVDEAHYGGPVYLDGTGYQDGFSRDVDDFRDWWESERGDDLPLPEVVWACTRRTLRIPNADTLIEHATENEYDDAADDMPPSDELQAAIDKYNASVTATSWDIDYSRLVVLFRVSPPNEGGSRQ